MRWIRLCLKIIDVFMTLDHCLLPFLHSPCGSCCCAVLLSSKQVSAAENVTAAVSGCTAPAFASKFDKRSTA